MKNYWVNRMKEIKLRDIAKIQYLYVGIFEEEDSEYPDYRIIRNKERAVDRILNCITDDKEEQKRIYECIEHGSWNFEDRTFKPICDELRNLGYTILEG